MSWPSQQLLRRQTAEKAMTPTESTFFLNVDLLYHCLPYVKGSLGTLVRGVPCDLKVTVSSHEIGN